MQSRLSWKLSGELRPLMLPPWSAGCLSAALPLQCPVCCRDILLYLLTSVGHLCMLIHMLACALWQHITG